MPFPFRTTHASSPVPLPESRAPEGHAEPTVSQYDTARRTAREPAGPTPRPARDANPPAGRAPARTAVPSGSAPATPRASAWRGIHALTDVPNEYVSTDIDGVFRKADSAQLFILHGDKAYAVARDPASGALRLAVPGDASQLWSALTRNASGDWQASNEGGVPTGLSAQGARGASSGAHAVRYVLQHPDTSVRQLANNLHLPTADILRIAAGVDAVQRAWSVAGSSEARAVMAIDAPLTPAARAFVDRWAGAMSADNLAGLMQWASPRIEAYLRSDEHRSAAEAPGSSEARDSAQARPAEEERAAAAREPGSRMDPRKRDRVVRMLTANPTMSYSEISRACATGLRVVEGLARVRHLQRDSRSLTGRVRGDLIDDFILFPRTSLAELAREHRVPHALVRELRWEFARIRRDWDAVREADVAAARPELSGSLSDRAKTFLRQWGGRMSAGNLALVMRKPEAAVDAYLHSNEYRQAVSGRAALAQATARPGAEPQPGPSGLQALLTNAQKAEIRRWGGEGMRVDSLSVYLGMPERTIEAYMRGDEYLNHVRALPDAYRPPAPAASR